MIKRSPVLSLVGLIVLALAAALALSFTADRTAAPIALNERNYRLRGLNEIVPPERYDNALFDDTTTVSDPELLGTAVPVTVYRARRNGQPVALILSVVAPKGYSGAIHLLVGINYDGTVAGTRVSAHHETSGLGDRIELQHSDWILSFDGRSLGNPPLQQWEVRADGGSFDQFTGATITPRGVVKAVRDALLYFEANRDLLFAPQTQPGS